MRAESREKTASTDEPRRVGFPQDGWARRVVKGMADIRDDADPDIIRIDIPEPIEVLGPTEDTLELDVLPRELVGAYLLG
jgi:hypothetical protein